MIGEILDSTTQAAGHVSPISQIFCRLWGIRIHGSVVDLSGVQKRPDVFCSGSGQQANLLRPWGSLRRRPLPHLHAGLDSGSYKLLELQGQLAGICSTRGSSGFAEYNLKGRLSAVTGSPAPSVDNTRRQHLRREPCHHLLKCGRISSTRLRSCKAPFQKRRRNAEGRSLQRLVDPSARGARKRGGPRQ